jgi:hypothetical protein
LLASLAAHAALFGGDHAVGGPYHALLVQVAVVAAAGFVALFGAVAWSAPGVADGSIVAARLRERLPGLAEVLTAAVAWYTVAEAIEPRHAAPSPLLTALALAAAAWLAHRLGRAVARTLAVAVLAILRASFAPRPPKWSRRPALRPFCRRTVLVRRRFARPPPIAAIVRA